MTLSPEDDRRLASLSRWAAEAAGTGLSVPPHAILVLIAQAGSAEPAATVPEVVAWRPTIDFLLKQLRLGVDAPDGQIPDALSKPLPPHPGAIHGHGGDEEPDPAADRLDRLQAWLRSATTSGREGVDAIRITHLRMIANSSKQSTEDIRASVPSNIGRFAEDFANALREGAPEGTVPSPSRAEDEAAPVPSLPVPPPPTSVPAPAPAAASSRHPHDHPPQADAGSAELDPSGFVPYAYQQSSVLPTAVRSSPAAGEGVSLTWDAAEGFAVYRVVAADGEDAPYDPDRARLVAATTGTSALDTLTHEHAVRHIQVWRHDGASIELAKQEQPVLHAFGSIVAPVERAVLRAEKGAVVGQWEVQPGTTRVHVYRIPLRSAATGIGDPTFRIFAERSHLGGIVDAHAEAGRTYLYQIVAEAEIDGVGHLARPLSVEVSVPVDHLPVRDLAFTLHDHVQTPIFDLSWTTPPGGRVQVHRTEQPPQPGSDKEPIPLVVLDQVGLDAESLLSHPVTVEGGVASMLHVAWPTGWARAYFTTVVVLGDAAFIGNTVVGVRVPPVADAVLTERVDRQLITFSWPRGADSVLVFAGPVGLAAEHAIQGQADEISRSDYAARGSLSYPTGVLDAQGCDLHLVSVAFDSGRRVLSAPATVSYPGLLRMHYSIAFGRSILGRLNQVTVTIGSAFPLAHPPRFVLVHRPDRLPLTLSDGSALEMVPDVDGAEQPSSVIVPGPLGPREGAAPGTAVWRSSPASWQRVVTTPSGFVRLFLRLDPDQLHRVALTDPPVSSLRLRSLKEGMFGG